MRLKRVLACALLAACGARPEPRLVRPLDLDGGVWRLRLDLDSVPARTPRMRTAEGTVDWASGRYDLDFEPLLRRSLPPNLVYSVIKTADADTGLRFELALGDQESDHDKVLLFGRAAGPDSIVGTWSEEAYCCMAGGRFTLWLPRR